MRKNVLGKLLLAVVALALLGPAGLRTALAHDDEEAEATADTVPSDSVADSIYQLINASYQSVRPIFEKSCFDCHSSFTKYPWYHGLPIIKGMIDGDIAHGRHHLDLTNDFPFGGHGNQIDHLKDIKDQIQEGEMPLWNYRLLHWGTKIEGDRRDSVFNWIDESLKMLQAAPAAPSHE